VSALLALLSALTWGTSDFFAGLKTKRHPAIVVVGWTQGLALVGLTAIVLVVRPGSVFGPTLPWAMAAGMAGMVGLLFFYTALATGTMGVVAPIASMGVVVPVVLGVATGDAPSRLAWIGMAVAVVGILLASGPELSGAVSPRPVFLAVGAAVSFGFSMFSINRGAQTSTLLTLWTMRATTVAVLVALALIVRSVGAVERAEVPGLAAIGATDALANGLFGWASSMGQVSVTSVLGSLYPVATILLARVLLGERLRRIQQIGVVTALTGAALIAA
jgi:drug/metabolite transporter (DMT)-like permease